MLLARTALRRSFAPSPIASRRSFAHSTPSSFARPSSLAGLPLDFAPDVQDALKSGNAVVALESTLITHGLPPPHSSDLAKQCEQILRSQGVTPATIAILNGRIKVGLSEKDLEELAEKGWASRKTGTGMWKVGRREIGAAVVKGMNGGTTVSGTMAIAHLAGIKVFSTGGIGGVHRGAETTFDISSDLQSLSDTPVAVVCAGSKSILDIGLTLEYLEAHAVPVAAYKTADWPAFYTANSGFKAPMTLDSARQVAETIRMTERLSLPASLCLGNPIPAEFHAVGEELQRAVEQAVAESVENGMARSGPRSTPWLLQRVNELTEGKSLESNKALIRNNVQLGGEVALEYAKLLKEETGSVSSSFMPSAVSPPLVASASTLNSHPVPIPSSSSSSPHTPSPQANLAVVGSLAVDITLSPSHSPHQTTSPGTVSLTLGGVASNVAGAAHSLLQGSNVLLVAPVGKDLLGDVARSGLKKRGMREDGLIEVGEGEGESRSATCGILLDEKGGLVGGVADMAITAGVKGKKIVERLRAAKPKVVCFDGNLSVEAIAAILKHCDETGATTFFEPTSNAKSLSFLKALESPTFACLLPLERPLLSFAAPNNHELAHLYSYLTSSEHPAYDTPAWFDNFAVRSDDLALRLPKWVLDEGIAQSAIRLLPLVGTLFCKSGEKGVLVVQRVTGVDAVAAWTRLPKRKGTVVVLSDSGPSDAIVLRHYAALELGDAKGGTVTGAGDNLAGAILAGLTRGLDPAAPQDLDRLVELAQRAAVGTLRSTEAVGDHSTLRSLLPGGEQEA